MAGPNPIHIMQQFGLIANILQTFGIMMGIGLMMSSLFMLKRYGESRTMMSTHMSLNAPLALMLGGVMFLILPTIISTTLFAFWGNSSPEHYDGSISGIDQYVPVVLMFVRLIGVASIMRAIMLFSRAGNHNSSQPGTISKGLMHLFGGLLCVHILGTVNLLKSILDMV